MRRLLFACLAGWAFATTLCAANLRVTDAEGRRFYLFVNGVAQSNTPLATYELHYLPGGQTELRVEIPYAKLGSFRQTVFLNDWTAYRFVIHMHPLGTHLWLKPAGQGAIRTAPALTTAAKGGDKWLAQLEVQRKNAWGALMAERRRLAQQDSLLMANSGPAAPVGTPSPSGNAAPPPSPVTRPQPQRKPEPESFWDRLRRRREERRAQREAGRRRHD